MAGRLDETLARGWIEPVRCSPRVDEQAQKKVGRRRSWQSLAAVKQKIGDSIGLRDLQRRFQARFKTALHPVLWPSGWKSR
jgi:hypothetical protein